MSRIDLSIGGWDGWCFSSYGRAKTWRLISPSKETYSPSEILELRNLHVDLNYLGIRVKQLQAISRPALSTDDIGALEAAVAVLQGFIAMFTSAGGYTVNSGRWPHRAFNLSNLNQTVFGERLHNKVANGVGDVD